MSQHVFHNKHNQMTDSPPSYSAARSEPAASVAAVCGGGFWSQVRTEDDDDDASPPPYLAEGESAAAAAATVARPKRKRKRAAAAKNPPTEYRDATAFKKDVWTDKKLPMLRAQGPDIAPHSVLSTAYFVPIELLRQRGILGHLKDVLTVVPKSKKHQGRETNLPYPIWHECGEWLSIPRAFGVRVFGKPGAVAVADGRPITIVPVRPLLNAATYQAMNKIDQERAVNHLEASLKEQAAHDGFGAALFCLSPGFGKTACMLHLIARLGVRALFVVPNSKPFMKQITDQAAKFLGPEVVVGTLFTSEKRNHKHIEDAQIVLTTSKSIATIDYDLSSFGLVIVDESHETVTPEFHKMYHRFGAKYVVCITATPERANHAGGYIRWLVGDITWFEERDITESRWGAVIVSTYRVRYRRPFKEVLGPDGQVLWEPMIQQVITRESRDRFMVEEVIVRRVHAGRRVLIMGERVAHMEFAQRMLEESFGIQCGIIVGKHTDGRKMTDEDRDLAQTRSVLIGTISIVYKSLDIPELDTIVLLCGGSRVNPTFWKQAFNRATRDDPDKQMPEIVLVSDAYNARDGSDGAFAACINAAHRTLRTISPDGFRFFEHDVELD